jgi:hypothetical protein
MKDAERHALLAILDAVDYTARACAPTEMVSAALPIALIQQARAVLADQDAESHAGERETKRQRLADMAWLAHRAACVADRRDDKWTAVADAFLADRDAERAKLRSLLENYCKVYPGRAFAVRDALSYADEILRQESAAPEGT